MQRRNLKGWLTTLLLIVGAALLAYVLVQYATMYREQRRLAQQWEEQNAAAPAPAETRGDGLTKVVIPKIGLDAIVVEGTSRKQLLLGPGHLEDTPQPGEPGNAVITAHRDTFFRRIYELHHGDTVEVRRNGKVYLYEVTGKKVVKPTDVSVLRQGSDKRLTLITCYPTYYIGPAPERLVVFTRLVEAPRDTSLKAEAADAAAGGNH